MELLKKIFPFSFGAKDVADLVIRIIIFVVAGVVAGVVIGLVSSIPVIGWPIGLLGGLVDLYVLAAIAVLVLDYTKVLK